MAAAQPTTQDVKVYNSISTNNEDLIIQRLLDASIDYVKTYTGRIFGASDVTTKSFHAKEDVTEGRSVLMLNEDLLSVTTITNGDGTTIASSKYSLVPANNPPYYEIKLLNSANVTWCFSTDPEEAITVEGIWGYSTDVPDAVFHATVRLTSHLYAQKDSALELDKPILTAAGMLMPIALPLDVKEILDNYRRVV